MAGKEIIENILIYAGKSNEKIIHEEIPAKKLTADVYELILSPGLALNMAKGDIIDISQKNSPAKIIKRGGNFCIHIYSDSMNIETIEYLKGVVLEKLNGSLDGVHKGNLTFSIPSSSGIDGIGQVFDEIKKATGLEWYFCNIYKYFDDLNNDELLDWWM